VQEGGYNVDYLGQHASGVVQALKAGPAKELGAEDTEETFVMKPEPADEDAKVRTLMDIDGS